MTAYAYPRRRTWSPSGPWTSAAVGKLVSTLHPFEEGFFYSALAFSFVLSVVLHVQPEALGHPS